MSDNFDNTNFIIFVYILPLLAFILFIIFSIHRVVNFFNSICQNNLMSIITRGAIILIILFILQLSLYSFNVNNDDNIKND